MIRTLLIAPSAALLLLCACGGEPSSPTSEAPGDEAPREARPEPPEPEPPDPTEPWLRALLEFDLEGPPTDARTIRLGEELDSSVTCPQPGTGCYVELLLGGQTTQVHFGDDRALQVWGPTEPLQMPMWIAVVEQEIDRSPMTRVNETGSRPDRLWSDDDHVLLLHDHSNQRCGGFCPAMIWIGPPDHPAAPGYGFPSRDP